MPLVVEAEVADADGSGHTDPPDWAYRDNKGCKGHMVAEIVRVD